MINSEKLQKKKRSFMSQDVVNFVLSTLIIYYFLLIVFSLHLMACVCSSEIRELWRLTLLSTIFQLYCGGKFHWWRKPEYP